MSSGGEILAFLEYFSGGNNRGERANTRCEMSFCVFCIIDITVTHIRNRRVNGRLKPKKQRKSRGKKIKKNKLVIL